MNKETNIIKFLLSNNAGASSKAICDVFINGKEAKKKSYPHDPSDINRCYLCSRQTGIDIVTTMDGISEQWTALVKNWTKIYQSFIKEVGWNWEKGGSAPETYKLMQDVLYGDKQ